MSLPPLSAPPLDPNISRTMYNWLEILWRKVGKSVDAAPISVTGTSDNITGILATANLVPAAAVNAVNDATCDSVDVDATNTTVRIYGSGGVGSSWHTYRNKVATGTFSGTSFTGKSYATTYYVGYDTVAGTWTISTSYADITGDNMVRFYVRTHDSNGVTGSGASGGGATGDGGTGGVKPGTGGGFGVVL